MTVASRVKRIYLYVPFAVAGLLIAIWFAIWNFSAATMRSKLEQFATDRAAEGGQATYRPLKTRGFPFYLRGSADDFSISDGRNIYACSRLFIDVLPYSPNRILFSCGGEQSVVSGASKWSIDARELRASLERDELRGWLVRIETGPAAVTDGTVRVAVENAVVNLSPHTAGSEAIESAIRLTRIIAADGSREQLIERVDAAAIIHVKNEEASRFLEIIGIEAIFDSAAFSANGKVRIEPGGGLNGRLDTKIENPAGVATSLANLRILSDSDAKVAGSALAMLAIASGGAIAAPLDFTTDEVKIAGIRISKKEKRR